MSERADSTVAGTNISRRRFLQATGLTMAAVGAATVARPRLASGASPDPSVPPAPDPLAGDLSAITETWVEPEVWRPIGTDQLRLNVVGDQNGLRFSYGGVSPGPTIRMRGDETLYLRIQNDLGPDAGTSPGDPSTG